MVARESLNLKPEHKEPVPTVSKYPPAIDDGAARHLANGMAFPDIALPATGGGQISLGRLPGRSVIYCYSWTGRPGVSDPPDWDDIPGAHGSTPQTESYRDLHDQFAAIDVAVFGLSLQTTTWQQELVQRLTVPFEILSDHGQSFCGALSLPTFETGGVDYLKRLTMVAENGRIEKVVYPVHPPADDAASILVWLQGI